MINHCDIVYATPTALFAYPPIRDGASVVLAILPPWLLGRRKTMEMALTGRAITAEQALNFHLINEVVSEDKIDEEVRKLAEGIARIPPATNIFSKRVINSYFEGLGIEQAMRLSTAYMNITEQSYAPGHYFEYFENVRKLGYREALRLQKERWSYRDEALEAERARLKAKR